MRSSGSGASGQAHVDAADAVVVPVGDVDAVLGDRCAVGRASSALLAAPASPQVAVEGLRSAPVPASVVIVPMAFT
jgi:hypothetical protein